MNQAMVPVDGHKEEPQICVIEVSMGRFFLNLLEAQHTKLCSPAHPCWALVFKA